jgi:hypothetical protein
VVFLVNTNLQRNSGVVTIIQIEHGKGFAVVAEEVRTLAIRTTEASKIIRELLETMHGKVISITCGN